ncbi:MAG: recombinase family protein [Bacteroidaceae bacterium]|nr:recombinase family protein [Bacteroidaceae bacterium]
MQENTTYKAGLYCRLSKDDEQRGESISIGTQRAILTDYCEQHQYEVHKIYNDDGYSELNFDRPGFRQLLDDIEHGESNMVMPTSAICSIRKSSHTLVRCRSVPSNRPIFATGKMN